MRPDDRKYMKSHEWAKVDGDPAEGATVTVGITDFAVEQLTDLVFVEMPSVGDRFSQGDAFGVIESVKAVSDLYAPVSGEVIEIHEALEDEIDRIGNDPFGDGWILKLRMADPSEWAGCLSAADYEKIIGEEDE